MADWKELREFIADAKELQEEVIRVKRHKWTKTELEDLQDELIKFVEKRIYEKPKKPYTGEKWDLLASWRFGLDKMLMLRMPTGDVSFKVKGHNHEVVNFTMTDYDFRRFMRKILQNYGIKPYNIRKNGKARYYI